MTASRDRRSAQLVENAEVSGDWWAMAEHLVGMAEEAAAFELPVKARCVLVEMTVDLFVLLTCWPGGSAPADRLGYLRTRRARMEEHAPWLYALPSCARRLLVGSARQPSLLTFVVGGHPDGALVGLWRRALRALVPHVEAPGYRGPPSGHVFAGHVLDRAGPSFAATCQARHGWATGLMAHVPTG